MVRRRKKADATGFIILLFSSFITLMLAAMRYAFYMTVHIGQLVCWGVFFVAKNIFMYAKERNSQPKHRQVIATTIEDNSKDITVIGEDNTHQQLKELYDDYYPKLIDSLDSISAFDRNISYPLLIFPFPEYINSSTKVMFVGKETHYWILNEKNGFIKKDNSTESVVSRLMDNYRVFRYGGDSGDADPVPGILTPSVMTLAL